jgi:hypothetical protein
LENIWIRKSLLHEFLGTRAYGEKRIRFKFISLSLIVRRVARDVIWCNQLRFWE